MEYKKLIKILQIPTLSHSLYDILELEEYSGSNLLKQMQRILEHDPLLTANIIKVANSPLFGFSGRVKTIAHAVQLLGFQKIKNIAFSYSVFDFFKKINFRVEYVKTFNLIIKKNLLNSAICSILIGRFQPEKKDEISLAALFLDIGQTILFLYNNEKYSRIFSILDSKLIPEEEKLFGFNHLDLAKAAIEEWQLPEQIKKAIDNHFQLSSKDKFFQAIYFGNQICEWLLTSPEEQQKLLANLSTELQEQLGLDFTELQDTLLSLEQVIEVYLVDFPELQKDLNKIIKTSSELIINLVNKGFNLSQMASELSTSQQKLIQEKNLLAHLLNLSSFFSSLLPPLKSISSLFEYFQEFLPEYRLAFFYRDNDRFRFFNSAGIEQKFNFKLEEQSEFIISGEQKSIGYLNQQTQEKLNLSKEHQFLIFPVTYHHKLHSFLLIGVKNIAQLSEIEISYFRILTSIIANSFQNFLSFESIKKEINKKSYLSKELLEVEKGFTHCSNLLNLYGKKYAAVDALPVLFHKLKNKLTPIMGYAQILKMKNNEPFFQERLDKIENTCSELTDLLNQLREFFRTDMLVVEHFNLNQIITEIVNELKSTCLFQEIYFKLELQPELPELKLNHNQISALLYNLLENSAEALQSKTEKVIEISTSLDDHAILLKIRDNGEGIEKENLNQIWSPFFTTRSNHIGVGLTICEKIIQNHHAERFISSQKGQGTEIRISFPLEKIPNLQKKKILLVDDEEFLLELISEFLIMVDRYEIKAVSSGREALKMLQEENFDLVISDLRMPDVSGEEIFSYLKTKGEEQKFLVITADPYEENFNRFLLNNKIDYLKKPFEMVSLVNKIKERIT